MSSRPQRIQELRAIEDQPALVVDEQGFITYVNRSFCDTFGWTKEEAIGEGLPIIIPEDLREAHHMGFSRFLASGEPKILDTPLTLKAVDKEGSQFDAEHYIIAEKENGKWVIGATVVPIGT